MKYRIVKHTNGLGREWFLIEKKGIFWGWNPYTEYMGDTLWPIIKGTEKEARVFIQQLIGSETITTQVIEV